MAHNVVQQRIDASGQKVKYAGCIMKYVIIIVEGIATTANINQRNAINSHQALGVKGRPAEKKGNGYSYCKEGRMVYQMLSISSVSVLNYTGQRFYMSGQIRRLTWRMRIIA